MVLDPDLRVRLALEGVRADRVLTRRGGAGPTDDGHVVIDGEPMALPLNQDSRYRIAAGRLWIDGEDSGAVIDPARRPHFYDMATSDGTPMHRLARLHGADVLATTVVQTCIRYSPDERCRYCSIEESLRSGTTTRVKQPRQLAEVAEAAVRFDGVAQMVMTTGTAASADRGANHLARCVRAVKAAVAELPVQVQCEPPDGRRSLAALRSAGADSIGIHVESLDDRVRARWLPGKATVPLARYWECWDEAVRLFGRNQVSTYLLVGLGEDPDEMVAGAARLIEAGVYPFVVPVRPGTGTLAAADGLQPPPPELVADVSTRVADLLIAASMFASGQAAGCVACGACSTTPSPAAVELRARAGGFAL